MCICSTTDEGNICVLLTSFIIPLGKEYDVGFKLWIQINYTDFTDWTSFLPYDFIQEIRTNPEAFSANT